MNTSSAEYKWDFFVAHAGPDRDIAEALYDQLVASSRVFLDSRSLLLGDDWDVKLAEAQRESLVTVVLISSNTEKGYYQREEIAAAIALARTTGEHRVVPVYLNEEVAASTSVPYGLRLKHGLTLSSKLPIGRLAEALFDLRDKLDQTRREQKRETTENTTSSTEESWTVVVFNFKNWGEALEKQKIGERFSGFILNSLLDRHLNAKQMDEEPQYLPTRSGMVNPDLRKYSEFIPFFAIAGFVANENEQEIESTIRVFSIDSNQRMRPLLVNEVSFSYNAEEMRLAAKQAAENIRDVINRKLDVA